MAAPVNQFCLAILGKKGKLRGIDLTLCSGKLRLLLLLSRDWDLFTETAVGCDSEEAPRKREPSLLVAFEGRWMRTTSLTRWCLLRKGQEDSTLTAALMRTPPSVFTPHTHCGEAISHANERGRGRHSRDFLSPRGEGLAR